MFTKKGKDSMDYQKASQYWVEKEKGDVHLDREELLKKSISLSRVTTRWR